MSEVDKIIFAEASLNLDDDKRYMPKGHTDYCLNVIKNEGGRHGLITNVKGNEEILGQIQISGTDVKVIGSCYDLKRRAIIYFVYAVDPYESYHSIIMYRIDQQDFIPIILEEPVLNFSLEHPIINPFVLDNTLLWTDGYNEPRAIDINRAIAYLQYRGVVPLNLQVNPVIP